MENKIKTLTITAIVLFVLVVIIKITISLFIQNVIIEDIIKLEQFFNHEEDVINYMYNNYFMLMNFEMIGLSVVLLTGCILISIAMYLTLKEKNNNLYKKITITIFNILNCLFIIFVILSLLIEFKYIYNIICLILCLIISLVVINIIVNFIRNNKTFHKTIKFTITITSVITLMFGIIIHTSLINQNIENGNKIIEYHTKYIEEKYESFNDEYKDELVKKYLHKYKQIHSSKSFLTGTNNICIQSYTYIILRDNQLSLTTSLDPYEKELYTTYYTHEVNNNPFLISLLLAGMYAFYVMLTEDFSISKVKLRELSNLIESAHNKVEQKKMTKKEFEQYKKELFDKLRSK